MGVAQPRISDIRRGKIQLFTIDALVNMLVKLGKPVSLIIDDHLAA
jgi:predicted XRE-type DNA-binding protein